MNTEATTQGSEKNPAENHLETGAPPAGKSHAWIWILALVVLGGGAYYLSRGTGAPKGGKQETTKKGLGAAPVVTAQIRRGDMGIFLTGTGNVLALNTVTVRTRVDGELMKVAFTEGQTVKQGEFLAQIDPRPYQVMLEQAEGQLARDESQLHNAKIDLDRYKILLAQDSIPKQQYDTQISTVEQAEAVVKTDRATINSAKLSLTYCRITSPLTGRIGLRLVDQGNMVHATDTNGLVVITQLQPIAVVFNLAQDQLPQVMKKVRAGMHLRVDAYDRDLKQRLAQGTLLTVDNQIDTSSGTVRFKAIFPNSDNALFPNQFVNARLLVDTKRATVLAPVAALQRSPQGVYVYVLKSDNTVEERGVEVGPTEGDDASIESGLQPGETVVIEGVDKLQPGSRVTPRLVSGARVGGKAGAPGGTPGAAPGAASGKAPAGAAKAGGAGQQGAHADPQQR
jgi:multidrug efflux system membrane fusion protein